MDKVSAALCGLSFLCCGVAAFAPYVATLTHSDSASSGKINVGFLLLDRGENTAKSWKFNKKWCTSTDSGTCSEVANTLLAMFVIYAVGFLLCGGAAATAFLRKGAGLVVLPLAFVFQGVGVFGMIFRALPLIQKMKLSTTNTSPVATWKFNWASYIAFAGLGLSFIAVLVYSAGYKDLHIDDVKKELTAADSAADKKRADATKAAAAPAAAAPSTTNEPIAATATTL